MGVIGVGTEKGKEGCRGCQDCWGRLKGVVEVGGSGFMQWWFKRLTRV